MKFLTASAMASSMALSGIAAGKEHFLIVGDSWGSFAETYEMPSTDICEDLDITYKAIGGTTAEAWEAGGRTGEQQGLPERYVQLGGGDPNARFDMDVKASMEAAKAEVGRYPTKVWVSVGGNDILLAPGCQANATEIYKNIFGVVNQALEVDDDVEVLITGYSAMSQRPLALCDDIVQVKEFNNNALKAAVEAFTPEGQEIVEYDVDTLNVKLGRVTVVGVWGLQLKTQYYSDPNNWFDSIHMNEKGYQKFFEYEPIKNFVCPLEEEEEEETGSPAATLPVAAFSSFLALCASVFRQ